MEAAGAHVRLEEAKNTDVTAKEKMSALVAEMAATQKVRTLSQDLDKRVTILTKECPEEKRELMQGLLNKSRNLVSQSKDLLKLKIR